MVIFCDKVDTDAQSEPNTLESILRQRGLSNESATIAVGGSPQDIFGDLSSSDTLYVSNSNGRERNGTVTAIDTSTYDVKTIPVGINPETIIGDLSSSKFVYVVNHGGQNGSISVIDTNKNTVNDTIPIVDEPTSSLGDLFLNRIYVLSYYGEDIYVIDTTKNDVIDTIHVGKYPTSITSNVHFAHLFYVLNSGDIYNYKTGSISVVNTTKNAVVALIPVGYDPISIFQDPIDPKRIYVLNAGSYLWDSGSYLVNRTGSISVIDTAQNAVIKTIPILNPPTSIFGGLDDRIYVTTSGNKTGSVLVIDTTSINTTRNAVIGNISVGINPTNIFSNTVDQKRIFVMNSGSELPGSEPALGNISVVNTTENTLIETVPVGISPHYIHNDFFNENFSYIANSGSNTVSVVDKNNYKVKHIPVGTYPHYIFGDVLQSNNIYVANSHSNDVSVVNTLKNEVVAGVTFDLKPDRVGDIICNQINVPTNRLFFISSGTKCTAKPYNGFEFLSWRQNLGGNSTRTINASVPSDFPLGPIRDAFFDDPKATLTVNRFGNFTAYFRALPPPVPPDYWASLFTVVATALVGSLLIPAVIGWTRSKRQTSRLKSFHEQMALVYEDKKLDENDVKHIPILNSLNKNISNSYAAGKINNEQYTNLKNEVSTAFQRIFKKSIESVPEQGLDTLDQIRNDITDVYSSGGLSNDQFTNLKDEVSIAYEEIFKKKIVNREDDLQLIQEDISDAYSKGKITKLHYDLLNERISKMTKEKE